MILFTAIEDFWSEELKSGYTAGLVYTIRPHYHILNELVHSTWLPEGKVRIIQDRSEATIPRSKMSGTGEVKDAPVEVKAPSLFERIKSWLSLT